MIWEFITSFFKSFVTFAIWLALTGAIYSLITPILKSLVIPVIWFALIGAIYSQIALFFPLNRIFFSANEEATLKQNNQSDFKACLK